MSNCNCVEENPRNRNKGIASARFCYPLSFCHKDRQWFHLTDRRKARLLNDHNHNSGFCLSLAPSSLPPKLWFQPSAHIATYSTFLSSLFVLSCVYIRCTLLTNPLCCSTRQGRENARTLWGDFEDGWKKVSGRAEDQQGAQDQHGIHSVSLQSDVLSQHSSYIRPPKLKASHWKERTICDSKYNRAVSSLWCKNNTYLLSSSFYLLYSPHWCLCKINIELKRIKFLTVWKWKHYKCCRGI